MKIETGASLETWAEYGHITLGLLDQEGERLTTVDLSVAETRHLIQSLEVLLELLSEGAGDASREGEPEVAGVRRQGRGYRESDTSRGT